MPRTYVRPPQSSEPPPRQRSCVPRFLLGLILGLGVAVVVQLYHAYLLPSVWPLSLLQRQVPAPAVAAAAAPVAKAPEPEPKPRLDFYEILPKVRVETQKPDVQKAKPPLALVTKPGSYTLQLGAFQKPEAAEERKVRLALLGFETGVVAVTQPKGPVYRVKMGPYTDLAQLNATRQRLYAHDIEFTLSKEK